MALSVDAQLYIYPVSKCKQNRRRRTDACLTKVAQISTKTVHKVVENHPSTCQNQAGMRVSINCSLCGQNSTFTKSMAYEDKRNTNLHDLQDENEQLCE
jgi:hypothetical protein